ncbi:DUF6415 family natural product biosynthesis protein [Streptomyces sp. NPDC057806]|uniref:DUF6415 family natural product biosynthesis protein n=1 Tax=Streptomyces sp. NPDC057806 TaxID=3346255 RepID=UPI00369DAB09
MRPSLALRRACQLSDQGRRSHALGEPILRRDPAASATETVALVLGEDSPLPDTAADVEDLALRLRGHVSQLGALTPSQEPALLRAQQLCSGDLPDGYMPSRVHLVRLAEATQDLIAAVQAHDVAPAKSVQRRRWWKPPINVLRGAVFALALACLVLAASVPRT